MKINLISAVGPPNDHRTWSGTTKNILQALNEKGWLENANETEIDNIFYKSFKLFIKGCYKLFYKNNNLGILSYGFVRKLNAYCAMQLTQNASSKHTLHFGTLSLPFFKKPNNQHHYLYTDGTWHAWSSYSVDVKLSKKQILNIDKLEKESYKLVDHIFSTSEYVKNDLIKFYNIAPSKVSVVGTGTGIIQPFYGQKNYENHKILFVAKGRFDDKGGSLVLKSFELALKINPNLHLIIVGQKEYMSNISSSNISTYGFIPLEDLQQLFNTCSLFLMPALNEPWGLVYIEAMLCKMPIMGLNRNSFPELSGYGKYGIGINAPDAHMLTKEIVDIFSQPEKMKEMGLKAQEYAVKNFTWDNTVNDIMDKIQSLNL